MARALKAPNFKSKLPARLRPNLPKLPDPNEPDVFEEMTLLEHMTELRDRIVKVVIAIGLAFVGGLVLADPLLNTIKIQAGVPGFDIRSPTDTITIFMKVALYIACVIALPVIVYEVVAFLAPGLTRKEKRILYMSLPFISILFLGGAAYAFYQAVPRALAFLSSWRTEIFSWQIDGNETITFYLTFMIGLGLAFQLPVIMFILAKLNLVTPKKMRSGRKYALVAILVVSAVITPTTDPFSMALVAVPLVVLYEVGILIAYFFARNKPKDGLPTAAAAA